MRYNADQVADLAKVRLTYFFLSFLQYIITCLLFNIIDFLFL